MSDDFRAGLIRWLDDHAPPARGGGDADAELLVFREAARDYDLPVGAFRHERESLGTITCSRGNPLSFYEFGSVIEPGGAGSSHFGGKCDVRVLESSNGADQ